MRILLSILLFCFTTTSSPEVDKQEGKKAHELLNDIRTNPSRYIKEYSFLKDYRSMHALIWNDTLAKVAEARAMDLAKRKYFGHVDPDGYGVNHHINKAGYKLESAWLKEKNMNYFESLTAGSISGEMAVKTLLLDASTPSLGHRKHLLGLEEWNASLVDIGIGFVRDPSSVYKTYVCVIIAKHKW